MSFVPKSKQSHARFKAFLTKWKITPYVETTSLPSSASLSLSVMQRQQLNLLPMMLGSRPDQIHSAS